MTIAETTAGQVQGSEEDGLRVFRGIPFAAAPVGDLRFRAPQPHPGWAGVRDATEFGPIAIQQVNEGLEALLPAPRQAQSEDCLLLNVWTPAADDAQRATMVWIHAAATRSARAASRITRAPTWRRVVMWSSSRFNYRLNVLGFLNDPELDEFNLGTRDQIAALRWVHENIANFGGDPGNVTIFGESSGGQSMTTLLAAPAAAGPVPASDSAEPRPAPSAPCRGREGER